MSRLLKLSLLAIAVASTTASTPFVPGVRPLMAVVPLAIIEAGTVSTLPKSARSHTGRVVVLRGRADKPAAAQTASRAGTKPAAKQGARHAAKQGAKQRAKQVATPARGIAAGRAPAASRSGPNGCSCDTDVAGGSATDLMELRSTETGLRVVIIGPDGLTRTRYVAAAPGSTARHGRQE